jgi:predicted RNA-binding Zn-ribbon protein involved in translation (DUF1610 family)
MVKVRHTITPESQEWEFEESQGNEPELEYSENCCEMAKEVWEKVALDILNLHRDMRAQNHADKLSVKHLDCKTFLEFLEKLQAIKHTGGVNIIGAVNSLATRYIPDFSCPKCKGNMRISAERRRHSGARGKRGTVLQCEDCGHKERF